MQCNPWIKADFDSISNAEFSKKHVIYSVSGKEGSGDSLLNSSFLNLNSIYSIMWLIVLHCCHGLSLVQSFPTKLDPDKAGLLSVRNTGGMYHVFIRHRYPRHARDTGGPQVLERTVMSKALKSLWWVTTRAARPGGACRSLPIHSGWDSGNSTSDQVSFVLSRAASRQDYCIQLPAWLSA